MTPEHVLVQGFVRPESRRILVVATEPSKLIDALEAYQPPVSALQRAREQHATGTPVDNTTGR